MKPDTRGSHHSHEIKSWCASRGLAASLSNCFIPILYSTQLQKEQLSLKGSPYSPQAQLGFPIGPGSFTTGTHTIYQHPRVVPLGGVDIRGQ